MKHFFTFLFLLPVLSFSQENYVANTANSATPSLRNTLVGSDSRRS